MKLNLIAAAALSVASLITVPAHASALAMADMFIQNIRLVDNLNNTIPSAGLITIVTESRTGNATSDFNGVLGTGVGPSSVTNNTVGGTADVKYRCAGDCGAGTLALYAGGGGPENNGTTHIGPVPTRNYSLSDMVIDGSTLAGTGRGLTRANAMTNSPVNGGGANATILNSATITASFTVLANINAGVGLDADAFLRAWVNFPTLAGQFDLASAGYGFNLNIDDQLGNTLLDFRPNQLNNSFSATGTSVGAANKISQFTGSLFSGLVNFVGGQTYTLTINQSSNATVQTTGDIPEPGSLALVGLALLGITAAARRRHLS